MAENIRKKGATYSYRVNYKDETGKWKTLEKGGFITIADAKIAKAEKELEFKTSQDGILKKDKPVTLEQVYDQFITKKATHDREKSTLLRYDSLYRNHLKPRWGNRQIGTIKAAELSDYLFSMTSTHAHAYIMSIHKFIKVLWYFADERNYLKSNIVTKVTIPKKDVCEEEIKIYTEIELNLMEERFASTNLLTAYKIARALGVRCGECFGLLWSDINWEKRTIRVTKQLVFEDKMWTLRNTKTKASIREIDLQNDIYDYLKTLKTEQEQQKVALRVAYRHTRVALDKGRNKKKEIIEDLDFINLKSNGELLTPNSEKILPRISKTELGIHFKYHNLRHSHASLLAEMNVPAIVAKSRLGHSKEETTMKYYTHVTEGMRVNLLNILNG